MSWLWLALLSAAPSETSLVLSVPITTRIDGRDEPAALKWVVRRDENERGVVPHRSGWMEYGNSPWLNHHLAIVTEREKGRPSTRWMSSALELDGLFVEGNDVILRSKGTLTRWVFRGWQLERSAKPPDPRLDAQRLAATFDTGLVHLAVVGDVMLGRATAKALDSIGVERAFEQVRPVLARADLRLGNLEGCLREAELETGPLDLVAPRRHLAALSALRFDALSLENNHCTERDAVFTSERLRPLGITGVRADAPAVLETQGGAVEILALLGWPAARAEALPTPALERTIADARAKGRTVIALVHFGEEYLATPTASQRRLGEWLLAHGVTAVFGSHPHVLQPVEQPTPSTLVAWSLGNFLFDQEGYRPDAGDETQRATVLEVRLHRTLGVTARTTPFRIVGRARLERLE